MSSSVESPPIFSSMSNDPDMLELVEEFVQMYKLHGEAPLASLSPPAGSRLGASLGFR